MQKQNAFNWLRSWKKVFWELDKLSDILITLNLAVQDDIYDMHVNCVIKIQMLYK